MGPKSKQFVFDIYEISFIVFSFMTNIMEFEAIWSILFFSRIL